MTRILKSDLTYSLGAGFLMGAVVLFFMQPAENQQSLGETLAATVSMAGQLLG
ncbi:hypothetical protein SAMN02745824_1820 [Parasphingorhabdus marina DSM 22363]|uniref:Uncharacterized protein n=1 Tax=Parasphingorhabdus marina DSM 22363 TaxID=1123272 RepID=A0A1N6DCR8_9SPHN|nr:hypothetical protein [Parasphingorhabdus marina]SIN68585.1 hypothetical protein SAMN02745824_1820 [Parasphingorhabdus marina DSM 22363]